MNGRGGAGGTGLEDAARWSEYVTQLAVRVESQQRELAVVRREHEEMKAAIGGFATQLGQALEPLRRAGDALVVAAEILEQQRLREGEYREWMQQLLGAQREEESRLAAAFQREQERFGRQLAAMEAGDRGILEAMESRGRELVEALRSSQGALRGELEAIREQLLRAAARDREVAERVALAGDEARAVEAEVSQQLLGLHRVLEGINRLARGMAEDEEARAARASGEEAARLNRSGLLHLGRGNPAAAARDFTEAQARDPRAFEPRLNLAVALLQSGQPAAAAAQAAVLVERFPGRREAVLVRGVARLVQGDVAGARADLSGAGSEPGTEGNLAAAGLAHLLGGDAGTALRALGQVAQRRSRDGEWLREAGFRAERDGG